MHLTNPSNEIDPIRRKIQQARGLSGVAEQRLIVGIHADITRLQNAAQHLDERDRTALLKTLAPLRKTVQQKIDSFRV